MTRNNANITYRGKSCEGGGAGIGEKNLENAFSNLFSREARWRGSWRTSSSSSSHRRSVNRCYTSRDQSAVGAALSSRFSDIVMEEEIDQSTVKQNITLAAHRP